ncbi:MAG: efflux RND transporter periplasmic adaptor subunit [Pseudomonadota bacterium]
MSYFVQRLIVVVAILLCSVGLAVALFMSRPEIQKKPVDVLAPLVEVMDLEPQSVAFGVASQGTVEPLTQTALSAEVAGTIVSLSDSFLPGERFSAGDVLLQIDPTNYKVAVETARANVSQRQIEFEGAQKLRADGYGSEAALLTAKAQLAAAKAELTRAERDLARTVVSVPYDGLVRSRTAQLGDYVLPGSVLGAVFAIDQVEVRLPLPDIDLAFVDLPSVASNARNQAGPRVMLAGQYRGKPAQWSARIVRTEGVVESANRMVFSVARIDDPYVLEGSTDRVPLPIGTFVEADIEGITIDGVVAIPREYVRGNNQVVFVNAERQLVFRELEFLRTDARFAYALADQLDELRLLTTTLEAPLNGMEVRVGLDIEDDPVGGAASIGTATVE